MDLFKAKDNKYQKQKSQKDEDPLSTDSDDSTAWGEFTPPPYVPIDSPYFGVCCPCRKTYHFRPQALTLRSYIKWLMLWQVIFITIDIIVYNLDVFSMIIDTVLLWMAYRNYMILHKPTVAASIGLYILLFVTGLGNL